MTIMFMCNRELRVIPKGWKHPDNEAILRQQMPSVEGLQPEATEIRAYETTSEGTPISPAFDNSSRGRFALARFCTENCSTFADSKTDIEAWAAILFGNGCAIVHMDGRVEVAQAP